MNSGDRGWATLAFVVAMEAERITHDHRRAIPADFDEMAACSPREAIRVAVPHDEAHEILEALNDPLEGEPRVEKTYSRGTPADIGSGWMRPGGRGCIP